MAAPERLAGRFIKTLHHLEDGLLALLLSVMVFLGGTQILLRNLFETSISWGDPLLRVLVLWIAVLGAMAATRDDHHIRIDLLSRFLPDRGRSLVNILTHFFTAGIAVLFAWHSGRLVMTERLDGFIAFAQVPVWVCETIMPLGFAVIALRALLAAFFNLAKFSWRPSQP